MSRLHVLRVFTDAQDSHGNFLGVFLDGAETREERRQEIAAQLGFSETVWVDDADRGVVQIFTPSVELSFAGHPMVGAAWLLRGHHGEIAALRPPAGELRVRFEGARVWIAAKPGWAPPFEYLQLSSAAEVDALTGSPGGLGAAYTWAWEEEDAGKVRARSFVPDVGIHEDEATGSAALVLAARLGRSIKVRQGRGSEILAMPLDDGFAEVGGRVALHDVREHEVG